MKMAWSSMIAAVGALALAAAIPAEAAITIQGTVRDCSGAAAPSVGLYLRWQVPGTSCDPNTPPMACTSSGADGHYSFILSSPPGGGQYGYAGTYCISTDPGGWTSCFQPLACCNGATCTGGNNVLYLNNLDNMTYTIDIQLGYSGDCPGGGGGGEDPGEKQRNP